LQEGEGDIDEQREGGYDGETTSASLRLTMNQMLNGKIGETCNLQPAQAAQDVSLEERASVSQEHESPIHMRFRSPFGKIVTPILLDESLSGLWSQSAHDLLELCAHCPLPLTFNKNIILNRHTCHKTIAPEKEDRLMTSHVILVHWHSTDMVLSGAKPWLCSLESKKQLFSPLLCWSVIFLEWKALGSLKENLAESSQTLAEFLRGYIVYKDGSLGFCIGDLEWQGVLQLSSQNQSSSSQTGG
jgi:hypothetical protein